MIERLTVKDLTCLRGSRLIFEGLSFSLGAGDALMLTGPNGSGKSSLLRVLAGLLDPFDGTISISPEPEPGSLGYLGHADPIKPTLTVKEMLDFWTTLACGQRDNVRRDMALDALDLRAVEDRQGAILSSGQRRRVSLARLVVSQSAVWLMDEPTVGLDTASVALVEGLVANHRAAGGLVVLSTHIEFKLPGGRSLDLGDYTPERLAG